MNQNEFKQAKQVVIGNFAKHVCGIMMKVAHARGLLEQALDLQASSSEGTCQVATIKCCKYRLGNTCSLKRHSARNDVSSHLQPRRFEITSTRFFVQDLFNNPRSSFFLRLIYSLVAGVAWSRLFRKPTLIGCKVLRANNIFETDTSKLGMP